MGDVTMRKGLTGTGERSWDERRGVEGERRGIRGMEGW